jgi:hypothetical protein
VKSNTYKIVFETGIDNVFQEVGHTMKVPNTGRRGDGSRGTDDGWLNINLSSSDTTGTESSPWEWFAASSSRLIARLFKALIGLFSRR